MKTITIRDSKNIVVFEHDVDLTESNFSFNAVDTESQFIFGSITIQEKKTIGEKC